MSGAAPDSPSLYLPDVEANHPSGIRHDLISRVRAHHVEAVEGHRHQGDAFAAREYIRN